MSPGFIPHLGDLLVAIITDLDNQLTHGRNPHHAHDFDFILHLYNISPSTLPFKFLFSIQKFFSSKVSIVFGFPMFQRLFSII